MQKKEEKAGKAKDIASTTENKSRSDHADLAAQDSPPAEAAAAAVIQTEWGDAQSSPGISSAYYDYYSGQYVVSPADQAYHSPYQGYQGYSDYVTGYYDQTQWTDASYPTQSYPTAEPSSTSATWGTGYDNWTASQSVPLVASDSYFYGEDGNAQAWGAYVQTMPDAASTWQDTSTSGYTHYDGNDSSGGYYGDFSWGGETSYPSADAYATANAYDGSGYLAQAPSYDVSQTWSGYEQENWANAYGYESHGVTTSDGFQGSANGTWEEVFDPSTNQTYFYNRETQETAWTLPS
ncbi:hypothetical protein PINS_up012397 [Pythium insidiosum]|nr:hypothetical protein PINS_up012397 [Pythium insidiosum]